MTLSYPSLRFLTALLATITHFISPKAGISPIGTRLVYTLTLYVHFYMHIEVGPMTKIWQCAAPRGKAPCIQANETKSCKLDSEIREDLHRALKEFDQIKRAEKNLKKLPLNPRKRRASSPDLQVPNKRKCARKDPNVIDLTIEGYNEVIDLTNDWFLQSGAVQYLEFWTPICRPSKRHILFIFFPMNKWFLFWVQWTIVRSCVSLGIAPLIVSLTLLYYVPQAEKI